MNEWVFKGMTFLSFWAMLFFLGLLLPRLVRRDILFGIRVPLDSLRLPSVRRLFRIYTAAYLGFALPLSIFMAVRIFERSDVRACLAGFFGLILGSFILYVVIHGKALRLKKTENWMEGHVQVTAAETDFARKAKPVSRIWFAIPVCLILADVLIGIRRYPALGSRIPIHFNGEGLADGWAGRSVLTVFALPVTQFWLTALLFLVHWVIGRSKQELNPADPEAAVARVGLFRRRWSGYLIFMNLMMVLTFNYFFLVTLGLIPIRSGSSMAVTAVFLAVILAVTAWICLTTGQGGSRLKMGGKIRTEVMNRDDDRFWKWGLFYFNPGDPAVFIEKRFGIGWTVNFGNWRAVAFLTGFLLLTVVMMSLLP
jgi:uncharacterized membrane protein